MTVPSSTFKALLRAQKAIIVFSLNILETTVTLLRWSVLKQKRDSFLLKKWDFFSHLVKDSLRPPSKAKYYFPLKLNGNCCMASIIQLLQLFLNI